MNISLIIPIYNEEEAIPFFYSAINIFKQEYLASHNVELVFINDGSKDSSLTILTALANNDAFVKVVSFSRNFGKEPALFAGLGYATGDAIIPIDVDLQDPLEVIPKMIEHYNNGADVVLGKRIDRSTDTWLKRKSAEYFYKLHNKIATSKIEENVGDFRLMSKRVVNHVLMLKETQLFMKGLLSWVGFKTEIVEYTRAERIAGSTKFNGWKLWNLALEGITSFSTVPLKIWSYLGGTVAIASFFYALVIIFQKVFMGIAISGYASIMVAILFLSGVQLIGIGVLGEYIGRSYLESKQRPKYIIESTININN